MYFASCKRDFTHPLSSASISNVPHVAAPLPAVSAIGTIKQYTKELIQGNLLPRATTTETYQDYK